MIDAHDVPRDETGRSIFEQSIRSPFAWSLALLLALYGGLALYFVFFGRVNQDEGWYLYAARLVYQGQVPYADFAFFQTPLLPYIYGLPQFIVGDSVLVGRFTSFALGLVTIGLGTRLSLERGGKLASILFVTLIILTPIALWTYANVRTEPLTAPLLMLTAFLLLRTTQRPVYSSAALVSIVVAVTVRASLIPAAVLVTIWVAHRHRNDPRELIAVLLPGTLIALAFTMFLLASGPSTAWFNVVTAQVDRHNQLQATDAWSIVHTLRAKSINLSGLGANYGFVSALSFAVIGAAVLLLLERRRASGMVTPQLVNDAGIALLAAVAYLPQLAPRAVYPEYFASVFPLFCVIIATWVGVLYYHVGPAEKRLVVAAIIGLLVLQATVFTAQIEAYSKRSNSDLRELDRVATYLDDNVSDRGELLTMDTFLAVETDLKLSPGWEMGIFSYFPRRPASDGRKYHVATDEVLTRSLATADAVALTDTDLGILLRKRLNGYAPGRVLTEPELYQALPGLSRYRLAKVFPSFGQFRDNLYVLLPRGEQGR